MINPFEKCLFFFAACFVATNCENATKPDENNENVLDYDEVSTETLLADIANSSFLRFATMCDRSDGKPGYCVDLKQCAQLLKMSKQNGAKSLNFAKCGPGNEDQQNPKVCCTPKDFLDIVPVEDLSNVLPKKCGLQRHVILGRIVGGKVAQLGEFPWMAILIHKNRNGNMISGCSGFLVHVKYVVTAAHCVSQSSSIVEIAGPPFSVALGEHNTETEIDCTANNTRCADKVRYRRVAKIIIHPEYLHQDVNHFNDVALLYLKSGAVLSDFVYPICLWTDPNEFQPTKYYLSGWGKTETRDRSTVKLKVDLPAFDRKSCAEKFEILNLKVRTSQICAGGKKNKDGCAGDSGGPLMFSAPGTNVWYAAGIVSYGIKCGTPGWPGVYTNVTTYVGWIKKEILANNVMTRNPVPKKRKKEKITRTCTIC